MRGLRLFLAAAAAALVAWAWVALHPSPEKVIRRQLAGVARAASFGPNQGYLAKMSGADSVAGFFATNADIRINAPGQPERRLLGREEIQQVALGVRASVASMEVNFPDATIIVQPDRESAVADVTLQAKVAGESDSIVQEVKFTFRNFDSHWLIVKVETVRTLK